MITKTEKGLLIKSKNDLDDLIKNIKEKGDDDEYVESDFIICLHNIRNRINFIFDRMEKTK